MGSRSPLPKSSAGRRISCAFGFAKRNLVHIRSVRVFIAFAIAIASLAAENSVSPAASKR